MIRSLPRLAAGALVLAFFVWLWAKGEIVPGSLGWLRLVPLFLFGYIAYELLAYAGEALVKPGRREPGTR